jgi:alpha-beta hydrolase superfamily lysophospholipase
MKPLAVFVVLLGLAACSPTIAPPGPPMTEPQLTQDAIIATDGARLPLRVWLPDGRPNAVILALHGFNDYSNAFALPAPYLTAHGIAIYAYDQRGFGAAPSAGSWPGVRALTGDAATALRLVAARHPHVPLYLLGESMGGAIAMLTMERADMRGPDAPHVAGTILAAPAVWARTRMNVFERTALWISAHTLPWLSVSGRGLDIWPSDNVEMLRALSRDPLVIKETRIGTLDGLVNLMDAAYAGAPRLRGPALLLYGDHDQVVPAKPTYDVMAELEGRAGITCALYPKGYHMLLRDLHADTVLADIVSWIDDPRAPLPSGGDRLAQAAIAQHHPLPIALAVPSPG